MDRVRDLFGIERRIDWLAPCHRTTGPPSTRIGVIDAVAQNLALFRQPDGEDIAHMLANGKQDEALNEAYQFPGAWDRMASGEIFNCFIADNPDIVTMCLEGIVAVSCIPEDGLFHLIDDATNEATSVIGLSAEVTAEIVRSWGGLEAAAEHAGKYEGGGSIATIMSERWHFRRRQATRG